MTTLTRENRELIRSANLKATEIKLEQYKNRMRYEPKSSSIYWSLRKLIDNAEKRIVVLTPNWGSTPE